jgi:hypothetical protein
MAMPGGRLQALEIAWDSRSRQCGGGGSFSTRVASFPRPIRYIRPASIALGITGARIVTPPTSGKSCDYQSRTYATTYAEIAVECEGCHGPGSNHLGGHGSGAIGVNSVLSKILCGRLGNGEGAHWCTAEYPFRRPGQRFFGQATDEYIAAQELNADRLERF